MGMPMYERVSGVAPNEFLFSTANTRHKTVTVSSSTDVVAEDADGNQFLNKGVLMAYITSGAETDKVGPYDAQASDGREDLDNLAGYLDTVCVLKDGKVRADCGAGVLVEGTVEAAKVIVYDDGEGTQGEPSAEIQAALQTAKLDIKHE